jgi:CheY-like chemotaxis protein
MMCKTTSGNSEISRVLLVDDEPDIVYLVKRGLERNGLQVDAYTDPLLALQNFKRDLYQLLLLDIKMQKMDGIELCNRIKKEDSKTKVCFFSASEHLASHSRNYFKKSQDEFLFIPKPIPISEMIRQIKQFLSIQ